MDKILDFGIPCNPVGITASIKSALLQAVEQEGLNSADTPAALRKMIALRHGADRNQVAVAQSEDELITLLLRAAKNKKGIKKALLPFPCSESYTRILKNTGFEIKRLELSAKHHFRLAEGQLKKALAGCQILLLDNPSYPSAALYPPAELLEELDDWLADGGWLILDERAIDFTYGSTTNSVWSALRHEPRVAVIRSFTALMSLSLCPLCYCVGDREWVSAVREQQFDPSISPLACALLEPLQHTAPLRTQTVEYVTHLMPRLLGRLRRIPGIKVCPSDANWVLCRLDCAGISTSELAFHLRRNGIIIHPCIDGTYFTLSLRVPEETDRFIKAARELLVKKSERSAPDPEVPEISLSSLETSL